MKENLDRMLDKFHLILRLARDYNSTLKMIESWGESRRINIPCNDVRESEVVDETESEPKIIYEPDLEPEREPEIIDESDPESEVEESLIETPVDI